MQKNNQAKRQFISYVVIKGSKGNPFGHVYTILSELDSHKDARPEVIQAIGQYGDPLKEEEWIKKMFLPARLIGPGHLKEEHLRHIADNDKFTYSHKTWEITDAQKQTFLAGVESDIGRSLGNRDFKAEFGFWQKIESLKQGNDADRARLKKLLAKEESVLANNGGRHFNIANQSCMADGICRLNEVNINTDQMNGYFINVPSLTSGPLNQFKLQYDTKAGKLYWDSPFVISVNENESLSREQRLKINRLRTFDIIAGEVAGLDNIFKAKCTALQAEGKAVAPLSRASSRLDILNKTLTKKAKFPNQIRAQLNTVYEKELKSILSDCHRELIRSDADSSLIQFIRQVMDNFNHMVYQLKSYFIKQDVEIGLSPFGFVSNQLHEVDLLQTKIEQARIAPAA